MNSILKLFQIAELRNKLLFTLGVLLIFRMGSFITIPGVNPVAVSLMQREGQSLLDVINIFSGGALFKLSVFSLGIMPYITASIIFGLLTSVVPSLARLQKEGEEGRRIFNQYTKLATILISALQSVFILTWAYQGTNSLNQHFVSENMSRITFFIVGIVTITSGTMILMWLGEQITERGIGNGISLIIFAGIIVQLPAKVSSMVFDENIDIMHWFVLPILFVGLIAATVILTQAVRRIPIQYGKRMHGRRMVQAQSQTLQFKLNSANVMPIIFASSLLIFPQTIFGMLGSGAQTWMGWYVIQEWLNPFANVWYKTLPYYFIYTMLIIFFAYFYTAIQLNPVELADNLKKFGGFIPGIRPGIYTRDYIQSTLNKIILPGAIFLAMLALAPYIIIFVFNLQANQNIQGLAYTFGGTSLLIIVGVALDTLKQLESQLVMRNYEGFMKKGKIKGRK